MSVICMLPQGGGRVEQQDINYLMLYDAGDECVEVTGGWSNYNYSSGYGSGTVSNSSVKNSTSITIKSVFNAASSTAGISGYMTEHLDLSKYSGALACFDSAEQIGLRLCSSKAPTITVSNGATIKAGFVSVSGQASIIGDCKVSYLNIEQIENAYLFTGVSEWLPGGTYQGNLYYVCLVGADDWQTWLVKAGLTVSDYASLDAVIADNAALTTLMSGKAAVDYMLLHCTGTVMAAIIRSGAALEAIANSPYHSQIFKNKHWDKFLRMAGAVPESEKTYLYRYGDECTDITDGWGDTENIQTGWVRVPVDKLSGLIYLNPDNADEKNPRTSQITTISKINLASYHQLYAYVETSHVMDDMDGAYLMACHDRLQHPVSTSVWSVYSDDTALMVLDLSQINDARYIALEAIRRRKITIKKIWLE